MTQLSFATLEHRNKKKQTKRERFLSEIDYFLQQWYQLSDPGAEEALYDIQSMRAFAGLVELPLSDRTPWRHDWARLCSRSERILSPECGWISL
mgnify:CR=1 FL=1